MPPLFRYLTMELEIGFGVEPQKLVIPDANVLGVLEPNTVEVRHHGQKAVRYALAAPIGTPPLGKIVNPGEMIVIVTSDITRPMPSAEVLPRSSRSCTFTACGPRTSPSSSLSAVTGNTPRRR